MFPFPHAGSAEWLAREAAGDNVHRLNLRPINLCHIAQVGDVGPVMRQDF
jgi:hypothetical protein